VVVSDASAALTIDPRHQGQCPASHLQTARFLENDRSLPLASCVSLRVSSFDPDRRIMELLKCKRRSDWPISDDFTSVPH